MADRTSLDRLSLELDPVASGFNFKQLYYFHAVAVEGSIAAAARRLKVTQPTISEQIKNLEQYLETPLFDRRPEGVQLTNAGTRVLEHTRVIFRTARRLVQELNPAVAQEQLTLEVGLCSTVSRSLAADRLVPLFNLDSAAPRIRHGGYASLLRDLLQGRLDILLSENTPGDPDRDKVALRTIVDSPLLAIAGKTQAQQIQKFPEDLMQQPFIHFTNESRYRWQVDSYMRKHAVTLHVIAEVDDVELLVTAAEQNVAVTVVPETVAKSRLELGSIVSFGRLDGLVARVHAHYLEAHPHDWVVKALDALAGS